MRRALALLAALALAGCEDRLPPPPAPSGVSPSSGQVDQAQSLQVLGADFGVRVFTDFNDPSQTRTDDTYQVTVGGVALTGVQHVSSTLITGTLPAGVAQGDNDLQVTDPWGRTATLAAAYFGIPAGGVPTALAITAPAVVPIGACQAVTIEQRNASGVATVSLTVTAVALDTAPTGAFGVFSDSGCGAPATSTTIVTGQTQVVVYVRATDRVTADLLASSTGLTGDTHTFTFGPTRLAFTTTALTANVNTCAGPVTVEARDPAGVASAVATDTVVALSANASLERYGDAACTGSTVASITIPAAGTSASFFVKGTAPGSFSVSASATGYTGASQTEVFNAPTIFVVSTVGPQGVATPFPVTIEAQDGFGGMVTGFNGIATLSGLGGPSAACAFNCGSGTTTTAFTQGGWSGWVSMSAEAPGAQLHAVSGAIAGDSNAFPVYAPDGGLAAPTARLMVSRGAVSSTGTAVVLDARLSSDYGQGPLEYSFDALGTAGTDAGVSPWTSWQTGTTYPATGYGTGTWQPRVAVRKQGGGAISYASATVVGTASTLCVVTTTSMRDDGASSCTMTNKFGGDGQISLAEAINLTNGGAGRAITTTAPLRLVYDPANPLPSVFNTTSISFASGTQLVRQPWTLDGNNALVANADISGAANWDAFSNAFVQDSTLRDGATLTTDSILQVKRLLAINCPAGGACVRGTSGTGVLRVLFSQFQDAPGEALRVGSGACPANAVDVQSTTFTRVGTGVRNDCTSAGSSRVLHATFHASSTGVQYAGGSGHVLESSVFTGSAAATACGTATFSTRDFNVLSGNTSDGCLSTSDPNTVAADPLYFLSEAGDLRVRGGGAASDSAASIGLDVNDTAPGLFFGAGPDRGGRETP